MQKLKGGLVWFIFFPAGPAALIKGITCSCRPRVPLGGCGSSPAAAAAAPAAGAHRRQTPWCPHSGPHPWKTTPGHSFRVFSWLCCDAGLRFECSWDKLGGSTALGISGWGGRWHLLRPPHPCVCVGRMSLQIVTCTCSILCNYLGF